jgi:hypothetical protein
VLLTAYLTAKLANLTANRISRCTPRFLPDFEHSELDFRYKWPSNDLLWVSIALMASSAVRAHARAGRQPAGPRTPPPPPPPCGPPPVQPSAPQDVVRPKYSIAQRVQCLTLLVEGYSGREIKRRTGIKPSVQTYMKRKAFDRGFCPDQDPRILNCYVEDGAQSDRPKEITLETEQHLLDNVRVDRSGREKSSEVLAYECGISYLSALQILHKYRFINIKSTRKLGLNSH